MSPEIGIGQELEHARRKQMMRKGYGIWAEVEFYIGNCWILTGMGYGCVVVDGSILSERVPVWHLT
jgi:hypothetical protein